jgi:hypothetical protein
MYNFIGLNSTNAIHHVKTLLIKQTLSYMNVNNIQQSDWYNYKM